MTPPPIYDDHVSTLVAVAWTVANVGIFASYLYVAASIVPVAFWRLRTKIAGTAFYALCGTTHLEMVSHLLFSPGATQAQVDSAPHMLVIHVAQMIAAGSFAYFARQTVAYQRTLLTRAVDRRLVNIGPPDGIVERRRD